MAGQKRAFGDPAETRDSAQSWPDFWSTVLDTNIASFDADSCNLLARDNVGSDIETWAQDFIDLNLVSAPPESFWDEPALPPLQHEEATPYICYGAIDNVTIKLHGDMRLLLPTVDQALSVGYVSFNVAKQSGHYMLSVADNIVFGQINDRVEHGLDHLLHFPNLVYTAYAPATQFRDSLFRIKKSSSPVSKIQLNVFGMKSDAFAVGRILSSKKLFLQDPDYGIDIIDYFNPHILEFPDCPVPKVPNISNESKPEVANEDAPDLGKTMAEVYSSTRRYRGLERMTGNGRIITQLKPHQEQALQFMYQRERGPITADFSLWESVDLPGSQTFKHKITGDEYHEPPSELGGGVLADDMGMGKTLSALALITKTLEDAVSWASENGRPRSKATLVVVPSGQVLNEWLKEIRKHLNGSVTTAIYHGRRRENQKPALTHSDIVFTTYHTLASSDKNEAGLAQNLEWFKVVLDEAHVIRRHATKLFQSASKLEAQYRWCLTGTPIQNSLEDFGSLLAFARIDPFRNLSVFRKYVVQQVSEQSGDARTAAIQKFASLLDSVSLRRSQALLELPDVTEKRVYVRFSEAEKRQYEQTMAAMARLIKEQAHQKNDNRNILNLFQAQLHLRILCNHGTYQRAYTDKTMNDSQTEREDAMLSMGQHVEFKCTACGILLPVLETTRSKGETNQILCVDCSARAPIRQASSLRSLQTERSMGSASASGSSATPETSSVAPASSPIRADRQAYFRDVGHSSKVEALIADVKQVPADTKCIIFSCWTRSLDLIALHLHKLQLVFGRIDGDCDVQKRQSSLDQFVEDEDVRILLMSTGVGALGLNLTAASYIFILEPQWNPSTEQQAIGRASRIGQTKPVFVTRYLVEQTLEMVMQSQQSHKRQLAKIGLGEVELSDREVLSL